MSGKSEDAVGRLRQLFPEQFFDEASPHYETIRNSFWSGNQKAEKPACVVQPRNAGEVAQAVKVCAECQTPFAVKSGGHGHFAGQSSITGGVQLDLGKLDIVSVNKEKNSVWVGTGNSWAAVYKKLEKIGRIAVGGRAASVGVGGFILGGGISLHAARYGWSIDNVRCFEVALADGRVLRASRNSEPDLFRALRGGGSNFGVVTSFELELYPYSGMWGGFRVLNLDHITKAIEAFLCFIPKLEADQKGHTILALSTEGGELQASQFLAYTDPVRDPPMFDQLREVPASQEALHLTHQSSLASFLAVLQHGSEARQALATITFRPHQPTLELACSLFKQTATRLADIAQSTLEIHLLPRHFKLNDDCYGLDGSRDPLICVVIAFTTADDKHDGTILQAQETYLHQIAEEAKRHNVGHPFLYMNYAAKFQDVITSYGTENVEFLRRVAAAYDPDQVFQRLVRGPFKLCSRKGHDDEKLEPVGLKEDGYKNGVEHSM